MIRDFTVHGCTYMSDYTGQAGILGVCGTATPAWMYLHTCKITCTYIHMCWPCMYSRHHKKLYVL